MARVAPASCSLWAIPQAIERLLASPKTTAVLPARLIMLAFFLHGPFRGDAGPTDSKNISRPGPPVRPCRRGALKNASQGAQISQRNRWRRNGAARPAVDFRFA